MSKEGAPHGREVAEVSHICKYAGKHKLLSKQQEYDLINTYQAANRLILRIAALPISKNRVKKAREANERAATLVYLNLIRKDVIDRLVSANLRLVIKYAKAYMDRGLDLTDLIGEGVEGIIHAAGKFETSRGFKFSTYETTWIRQRMGRAIENKTRVVKIPPNVLARITQLKKIYRKWVEKFGEPPTSEELSAQFWKEYGLIVSSDECEELGRLQYSHSSLDETIGEDENISLVTYLASEESGQPEYLVEQTADKDYVSERLALLPTEDASFLRLKYGFVDNKERSDKEMAVLYQMSVKEVKAKEKDLLDRLRDITDRRGVNTTFLCDVILTSKGLSQFETMMMVKESMGLTLVQASALVRALPARIAVGVSPDKADEISAEFAAIGANTTVINHA